MSQNKKDKVEIPKKLDKVHWFNMDHGMGPPSRSKTRLVQGHNISNEYEAFSCEAATKYFNRGSTYYYINKYPYLTNECSSDVNRCGWKIGII